MEPTINEIEVNGKKYVLKGSENKLAEDVDGLQLVLVRTYSAGVYFGYLIHREGKECRLVNARMIWYWDGACSSMQIAVDGVTKPENCMFTETVSEIILTEVISIIPITEKAKKILEGVAVWKK